jgi:RND family efflux transporter, MFP subunit
VKGPAVAEPRPQAGGDPFGRRPSRRARRLGLAGMALGFAAAGGVALWTTRARAPSRAPAGHAHEVSTESEGAMPVTLGPRDQARIGVTFAPVLRGPLDYSVRTVAQVSYDETRVKAVAPLIEGWVDRLFVDFTGQTVRPGDPLFSIYSPMVVAAQQELVLAQRLGQNLSGGTPEASRNAQDLLESSRRRLAYWGVPRAEIERIERTGEVQRTVTLRSPYGGVVVEKGVLAGQRIMPGDVAYRIADLTRVWLEGEVFERDLPAVRLGVPVSAEFTALPGVIRQGKVTYVYPTVNPETRTARIRVELANPDLALKPGMYATIRFSAPTDTVLSVPRSAVLATGERNFVFVRSPEGRFVPHTVTLGTATDERVAVLSGLTIGDTVVRSGTFLMDAESNLGSLMGGMANMPGMDVTAPAGGDTAPRIGKRK